MRGVKLPFNFQGDFPRQEDSLGSLEEQQHGPAHAALPRHDLGPRRPRRRENIGWGIHSGMIILIRFWLKIIE